MPELAEAALMAKEINQATRNRTLSEVIFAGDAEFLRKIIPPPVQTAWRSWIGRKIEVHSRGKRIYFQGRGSKLRVGVHLGMSGGFSSQAPTGKHLRHGFLILDWEGRRFHYSDFRRFSRMRLYEDVPNGAIGGWNPKRGLFFASSPELRREVEGSLKNFGRKPRISWLLEHGKDTGVGNYMANDALGRLDLSPYEPMASAQEAVKILRECQKVAALIFRRGGGLEGALRFYETKNAPRSLYRGRPLYTRFRP